MLFLQWVFLNFYFSIETTQPTVSGGVCLGGCTTQTYTPYHLTLSNSFQSSNVSSITGTTTSGF
jgi:hypothetical protein